MYTHFRCLFLLGLLAVGGGCDFGEPRVAAPAWRPERLAAEIMSALDADQDGTLNDEELTKAPGLMAGKLALDTNKDSLVDQSELQARFTLYKRQRTGLQSKSLLFTYRQKPLVGATVKLQPEPFLQGLEMLLLVSLGRDQEGGEALGEGRSLLGEREVRSN